MEERHFRFKDVLDRALMLRGNRNFADRAEYESFLRKLLEQFNAGRRERLAEELAALSLLYRRPSGADRGQINGLSMTAESPLRKEHQFRKQKWT